MMVAALYVQKHGCYSGLPGVDPWDEARDARLYAGPHPVVAHPPCARWCRLQGLTDAKHPGRFPRGEDAGCFASALSAVRRFGGVLEHPEASSAWSHFGLMTPPKSGGWVYADWAGGWTCSVEQGAYGHRARKATWLLAYGVELPSLRWGSAPGEFPRNAVRLMSQRQRAATPPEFRDLLISIARTARPSMQRAA